MARANGKKRQKPGIKSEQTPEKNSWGVTMVVAILGVVGTLAGTFGGIFLQDHFDVLKTHRELAISYSEAAEKSEASVESIISSLVAQLGDPSAQISDEQKASLRTELQRLRTDVEKLTIQVGTNQTPYQSYARAMADLASAADQTTGAGDADQFVSALNAFYVNQRQFKMDIAEKYRPSAS